MLDITLQKVDANYKQMLKFSMTLVSTTKNCLKKKQQAAKLRDPVNFFQSKKKKP